MLSTRRLSITVVISVTLVLVVVAALAMRVRPRSGPTSKSTSTKDLDRRALALPTTPQSDRVESELITILPNGFQPAEITRPRGRFLLAVENRSGISAVDFRLDAGLGNRVFQVNRTWERADWNEMLHLPPGRYVLTEASHPEWQCVITIIQ
ncbi:MAG TPA: hypothetical protein VFT08_11080 [Pyrinomonadaceae bacterium]|nr:hypothetical protein [Pyrinomonadaceae bacterium]